MRGRPYELLFEGMWPSAADMLVCLKPKLNNMDQMLDFR